jgi:hypothetical protein
VSARAQIVLSASLAALGKPAEALAANTEGLGMSRQLTARDPERYLGYVTTMLANRSGRHGARRQRPVAGLRQLRRGIRPAPRVQLRAACGPVRACHTGPGRQLEWLRDQMWALVEQAQAAGVLRADAEWQDVPFVLATAIPPDHTIGLAAREDQWRRNLAIILDGLRGDGGRVEAQS